MQSSMPGRFEGAPRFGPWVVRDRLLESFARAKPSGLVLAAPAGYGKTVVAAQYASSAAFREVVWIPCNGDDLTGSALLRAVLRALDRFTSHPDIEQLADPSSSHDLVDILRGAFRRREIPEATCIVLDDVCATTAVDELLMLRALVDTESDESALVLTTRDEPDGISSLCAQFLIVAKSELAMDSNESRRLVGILSGLSAEDTGVEKVSQQGRGHPALLSVLARHVALGGCLEPDETPDLGFLLLSLAESQLSVRERLLLHVLAVLGSFSQDELKRVGQGFTGRHIKRVAACVPLIERLDTAGASGGVFVAHTLAQQVFARPGYGDSLDPERARSLRESALEVLVSRQDFGRAIEHLMMAEDCDSLIEWLTEHGASAVGAGFRLAARAALDTLGSEVLVGQPKLLLLSAEVDIDTRFRGDAVAKAVVARDLALHEGDYDTYADALLLLSGCRAGESVKAPEIEPLETLLGLPDVLVGVEKKAIALAYLLTDSVLTCDWDRVRILRQHVEQVLAAMPSVSTESRVRLLAQLGTAVVFEGWCVSARTYFQEAYSWSSVSLHLRAMVVGNYATMLMEAGYLDHAQERIAEAIALTENCGLDCYNVSYRAAEHAIDYSRNGRQLALDGISAAIRTLGTEGDYLSEVMVRLRLAMLLRSAGRTADALLEVERAKERPLTQGTEYLRVLADIEFAATLLAMNDLSAASDRTLEVVDRLASNAAPQQQFLCDLILAEIARREEHLDESDTRLFAHREYVMSGNVNWIAGLYIRAFPEMLGLMARVVAVASIPVHLLRILVSHHAEDALVAARDLIDEAEWRLLATRLLGEEDSESRIAALRTAPPCRVRMFGGLDVTIGSRRVDEREWVKRKARLIFASLVMKNGREVPRDQFFEHLWPNMDEERARNNFYVIWSAMKGVLSPGAGKNVPCPYVDNAGGVCRCVPELVWSDVREFEQTAADARQAEKEGDSERAIRRYERLLEIYAGELLPGDMYEDWFSDARDRYRQEFGDAMLTAQRLMVEAGDTAAALRFIRRAIDADPWREDLVQAALRIQISTGQRSAAVETYLTCRSRLVEDLGLDPSGETLRLYEQVLAMEDFAEPDRIQ